MTYKFQNEHKVISTVLFLKKMQEDGAVKMSMGARQFNAAKDGSSDAFEVKGLHFLNDKDRVVSSLEFSSTLLTEDKLMSKNTKQVFQAIKNEEYDIQQDVEKPYKFMLCRKGELVDVITNAKECKFEL